MAAGATELAFFVDQLVAATQTVAPVFAGFFILRQRTAFRINL
jgi:hypothetical protein